MNNENNPAVQLLLETKKKIRTAHDQGNSYAKTCVEEGHLSIIDDLLAILRKNVITERLAAAAKRVHDNTEELLRRAAA